jgi:hypothetical protein
MVPARVESTPIAPEMLVNITSKMNTVKFVDFNAGENSNVITVHPAIMKEIFWVTNQIRRTCQ